MERLKGILYAALSSSTFGLVPFFTVVLLLGGLSTFELLIYRCGVATVIMYLVGVCSRCSFRLTGKELSVVFMLSLFYAATAFSLVIAYQNIASGVASTIHFLYPLAVALVMMFFFGEKKSIWVLVAVIMSLLGAFLLSSGEDAGTENGNVTLGMIAACVSVFSYAAYIIGVRKTRAVRISSSVLTCYVMGIGTVFCVVGALCTTGLHWVTDGYSWLMILGLALFGTAISNIALVLAIKHVGPTLTAILGALEPLTAVIIGVLVFQETFTENSALGVFLIVIAVCIVVLREKKG